jgi:hypothetical protein
MGDITTAYVKQYTDNVRLLAQQKGSKLRNTVEVDTNFTGEFKFYDQLGKDEMEEKTSRNQDTPTDTADHKRRRITKRDFIHNKLLDQEDQLCMIIDPKGKYSISAGYAAGRKMDDVIIQAFNGTAYTGKEGSTPQAFDASMQIAAGGSNLSKAKMLAAKKLLDDNDVEEEDRFLVCAPSQIIALLGTVEVASSDYNTVKALVQGEIDTWLGFKFIKMTRLTTDVSGNRLCYAYHRWAIQLAIQKEPNGRADQRPDKCYAWQVFMSMSIGATRLEEERIVEIACQE